MNLLLFLSVFSDLLQVKNTVLNKEQLKILEELQIESDSIKVIIENQNKIIKILEELKK